MFLERNNWCTYKGLPLKLKDQVPLIQTRGRKKKEVPLIIGKTMYFKIVYILGIYVKQATYRTTWNKLYVVNYKLFVVLSYSCSNMLMNSRTYIYK